MERFLLEKANAKVVLTPADLSAAANTGARVPMLGCKRIAFLVLLAAGTTGDTMSISLQQHDAASSGTSKALSVANPYFYKHGADTHFTKVDPAGVAADTYDLGTEFTADGGIAVFEVLAEDLDVEGNFAYASLNIADVGSNAKIGGVIALMLDTVQNPPYAQDV